MQSGPGGRMGHSAIWDSRLVAMLVFGGVGGEGQNNELWRFRLESKRWVQSCCQMVKFQKHGVSTVPCGMLFLNPC